MGQCCSKTLNGISIKELFPLRRPRAWNVALREVNKEAFARMTALAVHLVKKLDPEGRGANGEDFLKTPFELWFLSAGELHVTHNATSAGGFAPKALKSGGSEPQDSHECWKEPLHNDGGASILHLGLTLYGRRDVRFIQGDDMPDVFVSQAPGSVYFGGITGAQHQVGGLFFKGVMSATDCKTKTYV